MFNTPVLFVIFNRIDTTKKVFESLRKIQPKFLYIAADGPRPNREEDKEKCEMVRRLVLDNIDWDCQVKTLLRESNLGCGIAVSEAITWFFEHVEQGIILEDDCLPSDSFFPFCEMMLEQYKHYEQVKMIGGSNFLFSKFDKKNSYYFSNLGTIWGWATWRRGWEGFNYSMNDYLSFRKSGKLEKKIRNERIIQWLIELMDSVWSQKEQQAWDIQFFYHLLKSDAIAILPYRNLIQNIGYQGTHYSNTDYPFLEMPVMDIDINQIYHPRQIEIDYEAEEYGFNNIIKKGLKESLLNRIRKLIPPSIREKYRSLKKILKIDNN
ncbi:nucleotide-diphospho-sugar transferase [Cytophagaceae bacterium DM2B3-1]|uniref:Nucleotide-diphospho-sugar transferase n=1 Tax=Xanthocytophaga flava TaxID=3048013 RepID=A0ABT7CE24_9BACT|nr:nucleotide-diphospho-sugar transferase [Xanthocytophaga flavus]MDJ1491956.1 nucleotide-diphospho-sugar transferase [Xanthocytophaga flavus]